MSLAPDDAKALNAVLRRKPRGALKRVFALIRAHDDRALLAALAPARSRVRRGRDPLVSDLEQTLRPIMGPAREKADLLVEHLAKARRRALAIEARGLADAVRQLRAHFSDAQISAGAKSLMARLSKLHSGDTVV
ncbi:MAG: hypothetical protein ACREH4_08695 [Vitreimonas sp.]